MSRHELAHNLPRYVQGVHDLPSSAQEPCDICSHCNTIVATNHLAPACQWQRQSLVKSPMASLGRTRLLTMIASGAYNTPQEENLGVLVANCLSFHNHTDTDTVVAKAYQMLGVIR